MPWNGFVNKNGKLLANDGNLMPSNRLAEMADDRRTCMGFGSELIIWSFCSLVDTDYSILFSLVFGDKVQAIASCRQGLRSSLV